MQFLVLICLFTIDKNAGITWYSFITIKNAEWSSFFKTYIIQIDIYVALPHFITPGINFQILNCISQLVLE